MNYRMDDKDIYKSESSKLPTDNDGNEKLSDGKVDELLELEEGSVDMQDGEQLTDEQDENEVGEMNDTALIDDDNADEADDPDKEDISDAPVSVIKDDAVHSEADSEADELKKNFGKKNAKEKAPAKRSAPAKKKKKKKRRRAVSRFNGSIFGGLILVTIILTVSLILAVGGIKYGMEYYGIGKSDNDISFNIPEGADNDQIADLLVENGIINDKKLFLFALRITKPGTLYPGDITLQPSLGYGDIIEEMGKQRESYQTVTLTFPEGIFLTDVAAKLEENEVCAANDFLFEFNRQQGYSFENYLPNDPDIFYAREGFFFPDTYEFYVGDDAYHITMVMREHFDSKITSDMYTKMNSMGFDLNQTMTLASIVQMEAASVDDMPDVASVFINRLNDPDTFRKLQSDTTEKYIEEVIKKKAGSDESVQHYSELYDTYLCDGLPSGPICNPGMDAIMAVLNASDTDYYYFCNNLETGETFYAKTLEEHNKNLIKAGLVEGIVDDDEDTDEDGEDEEYNEDGEDYNENW